MKAERRHDLKTNALARGLEGLPYYWKEYGSRILLVVLVAMIAYLLVRYWNQKKEQEKNDVAIALSTAATGLQELDVGPTNFQDLAQEIDRNISTVFDKGAKNSKAIATAYLDRAHLNWKLANFPEFPGAATQPSLQVKDRAALLEEAAKAYRAVLQPPYSSDPFDVFSARIGLAAVAENQQQPDEARKQYQAIIDGQFPQSLKEYARERETELANYQRTPLITEPPPSTEPTTEPITATLPATTTPATTEAAVTAPAGSQPSTRPATTSP